MRSFLLGIIGITFCFFSISCASSPAATEMIHFENANSRKTYFTVHNIEYAHHFSKGDGVKVGLLDGYFGMDRHPDLYAGGSNFSSREEDLKVIEGHGLWMAQTLREIAPKAEIYALNISARTEEEGLSAILMAIDWAMASAIEVLTFTGPVFPSSMRPHVDAAVNSAVDDGIITTFIHYDNPKNIMPLGFFEFEEKEPSGFFINVLHYDYNHLRTSNYENYIYAKENGHPIVNGRQIPYLSLSSTSIVAAGFVAILKSIDRDLSSSECMNIFLECSYPLEWDDPFLKEKSTPRRVVDIGEAARYVSVSSRN